MTLLGRLINRLATRHVDSEESRREIEDAARQLEGDFRAISDKLTADLGRNSAAVQMEQYLSPDEQEGELAQVVKDRLAEHAKRKTKPELPAELKS